MYLVCSPAYPVGLCDGVAALGTLRAVQSRVVILTEDLRQRALQSSDTGHKNKTRARTRENGWRSNYHIARLTESKRNQPRETYFWLFEAVILTWSYLRKQDVWWLRRMWQAEQRRHWECHHFSPTWHRTLQKLCWESLLLPSAATGRVLCVHSLHRSSPPAAPPASPSPARGRGGLQQTHFKQVKHYQSQPFRENVWISNRKNVRHEKVRLVKFFSLKVRVVELFSFKL